jgi:hypothetical protein
MATTIEKKPAAAGFFTLEFHCPVKAIRNSL